MASSMPEIGSKISLISKADIRYEGKLFTVDPAECTIALSHVRSFGTEDRPAQYPVPAQSQIYEYILFRGSDIKDISIVNTQQLPNDPAIVSGMAPGMSGSYPSHNYNHPVMNASMAAPPQYSNYMAPGMGRSLGKQGVSSELLNINPPDSVPVQVQIPVIPIVKEPNNELLAGSRSSTPSLARKSPTIDQAVQVSPLKDKKAVQPPIPREGRQSRNERNYQEIYQRRDYRERGQGQRDSQGEREFRNHRDNQRDNQRDNMMDYRSQRDNLDYRGQRDMDHRPQDNRRDPRTQQQPQLHNNRGQSTRGGWVNRGGRGGGPGPGMRGRGRGGGGGGGGNFNRAPGSGGQNQQHNNTGVNKKNTLKFDEEYDFDKANSEFEELKNKTAKLKISDDADPEKPKVNGEDKKDDSGNETGLGEGEPEEESDQSKVVYYDKSKSFFDNISCEAVERSKGRSQRTDWKTERKLNSETFGVASARRGGYRGRGGYYGGRGMYRGYRGYNMRGQGNRSHINQPRPPPQQQPQAIAAAGRYSDYLRILYPIPKKYGLPLPLLCKKRL